MSESPMFGIAVFEDRRDTIACTPLARQLKMSHPDSRIVWFSTERCAPVLENNRWIDEVVLIDAEGEAAYACVPDLRASESWEAFYTPSPARNAGRFGDAREWDLIRFGCDGVSWILPFQFVVELTTAETELARRYWARLPDGPKILVETEEGGPGEHWSPDWLFDLVDAFGDLEPTFVFVGESPPPKFYEFRDAYPRAVWCREPFRQWAEFVNLCDVFVGVNGPVSALAHSTWCRRNVPHVEVAPDASTGAAALQLPEEVWSCYDRTRYREAITAIAARMRGDFAPTFDPRFSGGNSRICPACGETPVEDQRAGFVGCASCNILIAECAPIGPTDSGPRSRNAMCQRDESRVEHVRCALDTWRGDCERGLLVELGSRGVAALHAARERGLRTIGVTHDPETLEAADAAALGITRGTLDDLDLEPESVSVLIAAHDLPRQAHPVEYLERIQHLLVPGGIAYLTMPNLASIGHVTLGNDWPWLNAAQNACHVTTGFLRDVVAELGLFVEVTETTPGEFDPDALLAMFRRIKPGLREELLPALVERCCQSGNGEELRVVLRKRGAARTRTDGQVAWGSAAERAAARRTVPIAAYQA